MKQVCFILTLCISLIGYTQNVFNTIYDYGGNQNDNILKIFEYNNNYYLCMNLDSIGFNSNQISSIFKINFSGNVVNKAVFDIGDNSIDFNSSVTILNNSFYFFGSTKDLTENEYDSYFYKTNLDFGFIDSAIIDFGFFDGVEGVLNYKDGFLLLGFVYNNVGLDYNYTFLSHVDTLGNIVNTWQFGDGLGYHLAYDFKPTPDGGFIVGGETDDYPVNSNDQFWLMKVDSNINVQWYKEYGNDTIDDYVRTFNYIELCNDGGYLFGGEQFYFTNPWGDDNNKGRLFKVDSLGNVEWNNVLQFGGFTAIKSIRNWQDEGILVVGGVSTYQNPSPLFENPRGYLVKYTPDGEQIIWQRYFSKWWNTPPNDDYVGDMILTSDGGILVSGYQIHDLPSRNDGWLIKFDSCGFTVGTQPEAQFTIDSIRNQNVFISNYSEEYCWAMLYIRNLDGEIIDSMHVDPYGEWHTGINPEQLRYTAKDTGTFAMRLYTYGGEGVDSFFTYFRVASLVSGVEQNEALEAFTWQAYPNPTKEDLIIEIDPLYFRLMGVEHAQLCVYSMSGQKLNSLNLNTRQLQQKINIGSLADGIYLLGIEYGAQTLGFKRISVIR